MAARIPMQDRRCTCLWDRDPQAGTRRVVPDPFCPSKVPHSDEQVADAPTS